MVAPVTATAADARPGVLPFVVPLSTESEQAAGVVRAGLVQALRGAARHHLVHPVDAFDPEGLRERDAALKEAAAAMTAGRRAFETLEDGLGSADYARAEAAYAVAGPPAHGSFVQARVLRLAVRWPEDPAAVRRALPDLFSLAPDAAFPADMTPSDLAQEAARARESVRVAARGTLDVATVPAGAQLFVDGVSRGVTPVSLSDLPPGEHQLALFLPGHRWRHAAVQVGPNTRASYTLEPTPQGRGLLSLGERLAQRFDRSEECEAVRAAAGLLPANELLVAGVRRDGLRWTVALQRFALPDAHVLGTESLTLLGDDPGRDPALQAAAAKLLSKDRPRGPGGAPRGLRSPLSQALVSLSDLRASSLRPWLGGAALALVAGGVAAGLAARSSEKTLRATPQTDDRLKSLQFEVYDRAVLSDGLTAAGLLAGTLWGWWRFGRGDEPAPEPAVPVRRPPAPDEVPPLVLPDDPFASAAPPEPGLRWSFFAGLRGVGLSGAFR
ncbi:MAG: hypothetical protein RL199_298 [Pseudomonadota bacterium]